MYRHSVIGRLRDGTSPSQAAAEISALAHASGRITLAVSATPCR